MRLSLISCQVFCREVAAVLRESPHEIRVSFLSKGLHDIPCAEMSRRIQNEIDEAGACDAVLLAYGFCNHGIAGLTAREVPLVLPRAHDCITVLMGGCAKSAPYREAHPGAYYQSSGWLEHRRNPAELEALSIARRHGLQAGLEELIARHGEDNGRYLHAQLGDHTRHYDRLTYLHAGLPADERHAAATRAEAARRGWSYEELPADLTLLRRLVHGEWDEEHFLTVPPGRSVAATYDERLIQSEPARVTQPPHPQLDEPS